MESPNFHKSSIRDKYGIAERAVRRGKEGTSPVLLQSGSDEKLWADFYGMLWPSSKCPRPPGRWANSLRKTIRRTIKGPITPFGAMVEYHPMSIRDKSRLHQIGKKVLPGIILGYALIAEWNLERRHSDCGHRRIGEHGRIRDLSRRRIIAKEVLIS